MVKLIIFDMDGVIFEHANIWMELHKIYGTLEEGEALTKQYLATNYDALVREVVGRLWRGKSAQLFLDLISQTQYNPGVKETIVELHARGYILAIISSGPKALMERAMAELGIDDGYANDLVIENGVVAGKTHYADGSSCWPIAADNKIPFVKTLCKKHGCKIGEVAFVGDSMADYPAFKVVGLPIAFNDAPQELIDLANDRVGYYFPYNDLRQILDVLP